jgi:hypothetical protein
MDRRTLERVRVMAAAAAIALAGATGADATDRRSKGPAPPYVVAKSAYGNKTVTGAVRHTPLGYQVQLPGGTWIYCQMSCTETLRVETVDFWEAHSRDSADRPFGLLDYIFGYPF